VPIEGEEEEEEVVLEEMYHCFEKRSLCLTL
jgi:hypothetical protein